MAHKNILGNKEFRFINCLIKLATKPQNFIFGKKKEKIHCFREKLNCWKRITVKSHKIVKLVNYFFGSGIFFSRFFFGKDWNE